jgi:hypothetical protein
MTIALTRHRGCVCLWDLFDLWRAPSRHLVPEASPPEGNLVGGTASERNG